MYCASLGVLHWHLKECLQTAFWLTICSFRKSPRPEELSTLTRTASFRCVLKPMASRSALVLGRSFGGHVYVISPPSRPNMYVVPAREKERKSRDNIYKTLGTWSTHCQHNNIINTRLDKAMPCVQSNVSLKCFIVPSNDFTKHWATHHSWTTLSPIWGFKYTHVNSWEREHSAEMREAGTGATLSP